LKVVKPLTFVKIKRFNPNYFLYASFFCAVCAFFSIFVTYPDFNYLTVVFGFLSSVMIAYWLCFHLNSFCDL